MDSLMMVKVDEDGLPVEIEDGRPALQARSLANALKLCRRKLLRLREQKAPHTEEDVAHYKAALDLMESDYHGLPSPVPGTPTAGGKPAASDSQAYRACGSLVAECKELLEQMQSTAEVLPEALRPTYNRLAGLRRRLHRMSQKKDHTLQEVVPLQAELDELDAERVAGGGFGGQGEAATGQHLCEEMLNACYDLLAEALHSAADIPPAMQSAYNQLRRIKNAVRRLSAQEHHTVEELQHYQMLLEKLDAQTLTAAEEGTGGGPEGEALRRLERECYDGVEALMDTAQGMAPDVKAVHHRLEEYRHQLEKLGQRPHTFSELLDIQLALNAVDDDRQAHAGVFAGHTSTAQFFSYLLNHSYRMLHELYATATAVEDTEAAEP